MAGAARSPPQRRGSRDSSPPAYEHSPPVDNDSGVDSIHERTMDFINYGDDSNDRHPAPEREELHQLLKMDQSIFMKLLDTIHSQAKEHADHILISTANEKKHMEGEYDHTAKRLKNNCCGPQTCKKLWEIRSTLKGCCESSSRAADLEVVMLQILRQQCDAKAVKVQQDITRYRTAWGTAST